MNVPASVLFAALAAVFALLAMACYVQCRRLVTELTGNWHLIRSANLKAEATEARVEELADAFLRLRGKFYATRRESQSASSSSESPEEATDAATSPPRGPIVDTLAWKAKMRGQYLKPSK
jgi:hypothetical protein